MERYQLTAEQRSLLENLRQPFVLYQVMEERLVPLVLSDGFCQLFGYADRVGALSVLETDPFRDAHPDDAERIAGAAARFAGEGRRCEVIYRSKMRPEGGWRVIHAMGERVTAENGAALAQVWYTDEGAYDEGAEGQVNRVFCGSLREESMVKNSRYDFLTGLPSMTYFFQLAMARQREIVSGGGSPALLYIDFSGMKFFNSRHGFAEGDTLLQTFARILADAFGSGNCCRIGGDHFAAAAEKEGLEEKLRHIFREMNDEKFPPVHVGIYPDWGENVQVSVACDRAKLACGALKGKYNSDFSYYDKGLSEKAVRKQYIVENLGRAIAEKWIQVYYQPIIRAVNEQICDEEALARWIDPQEGVLAPAAFIPYLEDSGLIYQLDLYVVEQVLEKIKAQAAAGLPVVPCSLNLSRSDFEACDIVEEIRRRVDEAGVDREKITIEVTESVIGSDFEFMRAQVERFQKLGFPVWMDDFGSGYSSLDVLQSIKFNLLKFDMSFMRKLDQGADGKIILTELMKMATALGVDTVCEGVETAEQVRFLQEIGCSKLQGYYYGKPRPLGDIADGRDHQPSGYENPAEAAYYETIGRVNLYDLAVMANAGEDAFHNAFNTLPMGIIEVKGDETRFVRSNQSYRDFIKRFVGLDLSKEGDRFNHFSNPFMVSVVRNCCEQGVRAFYDEKMPDGSLVHSFARRIGENPVTGSVAVAIAVLSVSDPEEATTYGDIARALAADYYNIYVVDLDTERYIEYSSTVGGQEMALERHGEDFFASSRREAGRIYEEDREIFYAAFTKENVVQALDTQGVFTAIYRLMDSGEPVYVNMKVTRMQSSGSRIIIGISVIDAQMKQQAHLEELQKEREALMRLMALSDGYLTLITVDIDTGHYVQYSSTADFDSLGSAKEGTDFFGQSAIDAGKYFHPEDVPAFRERFTLENVMRQVRANGSFSIRYRLMIGGKTQPVVLKAAPIREGEREKLVVGVRIWYDRKG